MSYEGKMLLQLKMPQRKEVKAAYIVPHREKDKDDIWNAIALCHVHHWAFDVGWFILLDNYSIQISSKINK